MFLLAITVALFGLVLIVIGRRGSMVGQHPRCAGCGYDLHGLPLETRRCPECGSDILAGGAITLGRRVPIYSAIVVGVVLILTGLGAGAVTFVPWWTAFDGSPYKPLFWLERGVNAPDPKQQERSCAELLRRIHADRLSQSDADRLADILLPLQADRAVRWNTRWGDLIQAARAARRLSDDRWRRYLAQALQVTVTARPRAAATDPVPVALTGRWRAGTELGALAPASLQPRLDVALGDRRAAVPLTAKSVDIIPMSPQWAGMWHADPAAAPLPVGRHDLHIDLAMILRDRAGLEVTTSQSLTLPLQVVPAGESSVRLVPHPELAEAVDQAIHLRMGRTAGGRPAPGQLGSVFVSGPPMPVAFRVSLRQNGRQWLLAWLLVRPDDAGTIPLILTGVAAGDGPAAGPAEIAFTPAPSLAVATVDLLEIWSGEIRRPVTLDPR